jgi:pimeloyl-ACP methyl ester carboxylesterase
MLLDGDDPDGKDLGDGITAPRLMSDAHLIPGFFKIDGYTAISEFITNNFDVVRGVVDDDSKPANFFEFPYDWRRYNRVAALRLEKLIESRLPQWRKASGNENAKVVLIGHSMGGLVSRYYLEKLEGWKKCRALITFGTPYRGAVNALDFLANGYKKRFIDLSDVLRSFSSTYELLPIYPVVKVKGNYKRIENVAGIPKIDTARVAEARQNFHEEIIKAVDAHQSDAAYLKSYKIIPIVGTRQPTLQSAVFENNQLVANEVVPSSDEKDQLLAEGDGTVPRLSATPVELSSEYRETYFAERHASLQNNEQVLGDLMNRLKQMQTNLSQFRGAAPSPQTEGLPAISLGLDDLYLPTEPVTMKVRLINVNDQIKSTPPTAQITPVTAGKATIERAFVTDGPDWKLVTDPLPVGSYRVQVSSNEFIVGCPPTVHDIFEVNV